MILAYFCHLDPNDQAIFARTMLVNYREFFNPPTSAEEMVAFAKAMRDRDSTARDTRGDRKSVSSLKRASTVADSDEVYDDIFSSSSSAGEEDSDQVITNFNKRIM